GRKRTYVAHARSAVHRRERRWRRWYDRFAPRHARQAGWLHDPDGPYGNSRDLGIALSESRLQTGYRFRAYWRGRGASAPYRRKEGISSKSNNRIHQLRESERREVEYGAYRRRVDVVQLCARAQRGAGRETRLDTVWRQRPGDDRAARRSSRLLHGYHS